MGNFVSIQFSCDGQTMNRIFGCLCGKGYIRSIKENLRVLQREFVDLKAIEDEVQNKVTREEETGHRQRLQTVKVWLERVEQTDKNFNDLLGISPTQLQKLCLCGLCSKNLYSSYKYGKKVSLLLEEVNKLKLEANFEVVSEPTSTSAVEERPTRPTVGHDIMLERAWNRLMEEEVGIMGLHGMGGVGKTTLFKKMHNKFGKLVDRFDKVIWVVVSQNAKISKLQEDIAQKLHFSGHDWTNKNESDKSTDIHRILKGNRFVLMLDDIWEKVDLEAIGIPFPTRENGCKVVFTTRSLEVCGRMEAQESMQVNCLQPDEAWELFKKKVGDNVLERDPVIFKLAKRVAEKCRGLPLALNVIGETMASKTTVEEWEYAIDVLISSAAEFSDMENKILPILKYSYDNLADENIKSCFLYCALFPEDCVINKYKLIHYWMCEGFIGENLIMKRDINKGHEVIGTLIRASLLMALNTRTVVMHDVVREMALWIASDFGKQKEKFVVHPKLGLCEVPKFKDCVVKKMSLMDNSIEEIPLGSKCFELTTLFLQNNIMKSLSSEFIESMQKLVVLDLSGNRNFQNLPEQISELVSLQFLNLSNTGIEELPIGFQRLKELRHLDLCHTRRLCSLGGISKLWNLRIFILLRSNVHGDVSLLKELQLLEHLQLLNITISTKLGLEQILYDQRLANCINNLHILVPRCNISLVLKGIENLRMLWVESNHVSAYLTDMKLTESISPSFWNLYSVNIIGCSENKDLTWLLFVPNLIQLVIESMENLEEVINKEKAANLTGITTPFQKLEYIHLRSLPQLKNIYWTPLPFPFLKHIEATECPKLNRLPLNASSTFEKLKIRMCPPEQKTDLEWEDEDTKNRFLPLFT